MTSFCLYPSSSCLWMEVNKATAVTAFLQTFERRKLLHVPIIAFHWRCSNPDPNNISFELALKNRRFAELLRWYDVLMWKRRQLDPLALIELVSVVPDFPLNVTQYNTIRLPEATRRQLSAFLAFQRFETARESDYPSPMFMKLLNYRMRAREDRAAFEELLLTDLPVLENEIVIALTLYNFTLVFEERLTLVKEFIRRGKWKFAQVACDRVAMMLPDKDRHEFILTMVAVLCRNDNYGLSALLLMKHQLWHVALEVGVIRNHAAMLDKHLWYVDIETFEYKGIGPLIVVLAQLLLAAKNNGNILSRIGRLLVRLPRIGPLALTAELNNLHQ